MLVPGKERAPRHDHPNFYWLQEDWLQDFCAAQGTVYTIWRPPMIIGHAVGAPMNLLAAIAVYGALCQAEGRPMGWPGGAGGVLDAVDARLLARAFAWAAGADGSPNPAAAGETFNITNGDQFVFPTLWPALAAAFGLPGAPDAPQRLQDTLPPRAAAWDALVRRHDLRAPASMAEFLGDSLIYADLFFNAGNAAAPPSTLLSTIKLRQAGFPFCIDSADMLLDWIEELRRINVLPPR